MEVYIEEIKVTIGRKNQHSVVLPDHITRDNFISMSRVLNSNGPYLNTWYVEVAYWA